MRLDSKRVTKCKQMDPRNCMIFSAHTFRRYLINTRLKT
uniref:Uncharacterized protein n=1 Tax=Manihot esculenta TaxID=3983 RepID=A0A2C9WRC2_MANES